MNEISRATTACSVFFSCLFLCPLRARAENVWRKSPHARSFKSIDIGFGWGRPASRTEKRLGGLVLSAGHAGGGDFPRLRKMTHGNTQPFEYDNIWSIGREAEMDLDLGCVAPLDSLNGSCAVEDIEADWSHASVLYSCETGAGKDSGMSLTLSRLTPAALVRSKDREIVFCRDCDRKYTSSLAFAAVPVKGGIKVVDLKSSFVPTADMTEPWVLVWFDENVALDCRRTPYGKKYKANYPLLFVFPVVPEAIEPGNGLGIACAEAFERTDDGLDYSAILLPLFCDEFPPQEEVNGWRDAGLPAAISERCSQWCRMLEKFPLSANEICTGYDEEDDAIRLSCAFEYFEFRGEADGAEGEPHAPVPPMLALAMEMGFPAEIEGGWLSDTGLITPYGPYLVVKGADNYTITIRGMGKYALEKRVPAGDVSTAEPAQALLAREVDRILDCGHLAPWLPVSRNFQFPPEHPFPHWEPPHCVFGKPGDILECLAEAMPLLPEEYKPKIAAYLEAERTAYPPEGMLSIPFDQGTRREWSRFPEELMPAVVKEHAKRGFHSANKCLPADALYSLDRYYSVAPAGADHASELVREAPEMLTPYLDRLDWASMGWHKWNDKFILFHGGIVSGSYFWYASDPWYGNGGVLDANAWLKGMIGYVRLARRAGDKTAENGAWGLFGKALALRHALAKRNLFLYKRGLLPPANEMLDDENNQPTGLLYDHGRPNNPIFIWKFRDEYDHLSQVCIMNEFVVWPNVKLGPRALPPFFRDVCPEIGRFFADWLKPETERLVERIEENFPDWHTAFCESIIGGDGMSFLYPHEAHQLFLAKAWVCGEGAERLERYLDVPWVRAGDLYYIDKLREIVLARAGCKWQREEK